MIPFFTGFPESEPVKGNNSLSQVMIGASSLMRQDSRFEEIRLCQRLAPGRFHVLRLLCPFGLAKGILLLSPDLFRIHGKAEEGLLEWRSFFSRHARGQGLWHGSSRDGFLAARPCIRGTICLSPFCLAWRSIAGRCDPLFVGTQLFRAVIN